MPSPRRFLRNLSRTVFSCGSLGSRTNPSERVPNRDSPSSQAYSVRLMETVPVPNCPVCSVKGSVLYRDLPDRLFRTEGLWTYKSCTEACGTLWIDPIPG